MTYRIPPLNALRAFEAAARHLSFKQAAAELNVTPGAVSQQVKGLEEVLGVSLFDRVHNGLMLTAEGQHYLTPVRSAFTTLSDATALISPKHGKIDLTVGSDTQFAVKWLVPQMAQFQALHPEIRARIGEADGPEAVVRGEVGVALLKGVSSYAGLKCDLVFEEERFPVAGRESLPEDGAEDLTLLIAGDRAIWEAWIRRAGWPPLDSLRCVELAERGLAIRSAMAGAGLAMGSSMADAAELADGRLVQAHEASVRHGAASYYAVYPAGRSDCPAEEAFLAWLSGLRAAGPSNAREPSNVRDAGKRIAVVR